MPPTGAVVPHFTPLECRSVTAAPANYLGPYRLLNVVNTSKTCLVWKAYHDDLEEFRSWKSQTDRRFADMQARLAEEQERARRAQEERDQYEQYVAQAQLVDAEPQQVAAYYQKQIQKVREEQRHAEETRRREAALGSTGLQDHERA